MPGARRGKGATPPAIRAAAAPGKDNTMQKIAEYILTHYVIRNPWLLGLLWDTAFRS